MDILIATSSTSFAKGLQNSFEKHNVNVLEIVTALEDLLDILAKNPNINAVLLKTDLAKKGEDPRLEHLSDALLSIRAQPQFEHIVFTVLTDYEEGHPFLAELFEMGIYNFFSRNGNEFTIKNLIDSFTNQMSFSLSVKYRNVDPSIPWRRNFAKPQSLTVNFTGAEQEENESEKIAPEENQKSIKIPSIQLPQIKLRRERETTNQLQSSDIEVENEEDSWELERNSTKEVTKVIGTVVIAVASVKSHLGSTNTAISMATHLRNNGYDVAVVEANHSMDFDRMHALIEGENLNISDMEYHFKDIPHFKYREGFDIGRIFQLYKYVVLDMGELDYSPYKEEFFRSHIKCVVASGDEWKFYWIEEFLLKNDIEDPVFLLPSTNDEIAADVSKRLKDKHYVYPITNHSSPYIVPDESANVYNNIIEEYKMSVDFSNEKNYKKFMQIGIGSAFLMLSLFLLVMLFKTI